MEMSLSVHLLHTRLGVGCCDQSPCVLALAKFGIQFQRSMSSSVQTHKEWLLNPGGAEEGESPSERAELKQKRGGVKENRVLGTTE